MSSYESNPFKIALIIIIVLVVIVVLMNYGSVIKLVYPPNPVVVSQSANDKSSRLFEYSTIIEAAIRNDGGDGDIVMEATVIQKGNHWKKTIKKYFEAKETSTLKLQFDEVKLLDGQIKYYVNAYPFGK